MFQGVWTAGLTWSTRADRNSQRHKTDYEVLEELGSGGFGMVYRVKHRLDGQEYAMKVVRASSSSTEMQKILREVQVLSSIRSDHVVRYYSAWMERGDLATNNNNSIDGEDQPTKSFTTGWWSQSRDFSTSTSSSQEVSSPTCHLCQSTYKDWEVTLEQWGLIDAVLQPLNLCIACYKKSIPAEVDISNISIRETKVLPECLYILMEYCESTLPDAVQLCRGDKDQADEAKIWSLFGQILEGFAYLHANGIIHRDVKPSNIFVHNNMVKIGDLGLATTTFSSIMNGHETRNSDNDDSDGPQSQANQVSLNPKSSDVGTVLYAAPEVRSSRYYDEKADVYSLGIVLVEMFHSFSTGMERVMVLSDVRKGIFPQPWADQNPYAVDLARRMLQHDSPTARPSCFEILQELQTKGLCQENSTQHLVTNLQSQIYTLQQTVDIQGQEIERLRMLLEKNNISADSEVTTAKDACEEMSLNQ